MLKKKKTKKKALSAEDSLRAFVTMQLSEAVEGMSSSERAAVVDGVIEAYGPALLDLTHAAILAVYSVEMADDEDEDDEEDED